MRDHTGGGRGGRRGDTFRSVVLTGAARGLGAALASRFAAEPGARLLLLDRDAAALAGVAAACHRGGQATEVRTAALDVRDAAAMGAALRAFDAEAPVDLAVSNAAVAHGTRPDGTPETAREAAECVAVNLIGAMNLAGPLLDGLRARGGRLGLVASLVAFRGLPDSPGYCASKAGLWAWGEALRASGLRVTLVAPGPFDSAMGRRFVGPGSGAGSRLGVEAAAGRVERALRRGDAECAFPLSLALPLRAMRLLPPRLADRLLALRRFGVRPEEGGASPAAAPGATDGRDPARDGADLEAAGAVEAAGAAVSRPRGR